MNFSVRWSICLKYFRIVIFVVVYFSMGTNVSASKDTSILRITPSKNDYVTIQKALESTAKSSVLKIILDGTFYISKTLKTARPKTVIEFAQNASIHLLDQKNGGIILAHNNSILKGGCIIGNGLSTPNFYQGFGIMIYGSDSCMVENVKLSNISGIAIFLCYNGNKGCNYNTIKNNNVSNSVMKLGDKGDESGILLGYSGDNHNHNFNKIENNFVDGNNILKNGIGIIGHGQKNTFSGNTIQNVLSYGIIAYESAYTDISLRNNVITKNVIKNVGEIGRKTTVKGMGIYVMKSLNSVISDNKVYNTLRNSDRSETLGAGAITLNGAPGCIVEKNFIEGSEMYGIVIATSFGAKIKQNTVADIKKSAVYVINSNDVNIFKNIFKEINEVVIKGYFENTSLSYIKKQWKTSQYLNKVTGKNIVIDANVITSDKQILFFRGTTAKDKGINNIISNNKFLNNKIITVGTTKNIDTVVKFENSTNLNTISGNQIQQKE